MQLFENPSLLLDNKTSVSGKIAWRSPSNLAIIKYWGKYGRQFPQNPSISFTLSNAFSETTLEYQKRIKDVEGIELSFFFEDKPNPAFRKKVHAFLESILDIFPFMQQLDFTIRSTNSFPHSAGIASSASAMSALALCLCSLEKKLFDSFEDKASFLQKASYIARLGSGSACRSVYPFLGQWGTSDVLESSSNEFAIPYTDKVHDIFKSFHDDIMIVSKQEKNVSSRAGHALMENNIYASQRYQQANERFVQLLDALEKGDVETFGKIAEDEALTLHALMMASEPSYMLLRPNTITMIDRIRDFRNETKLPVYFSLDAGPNIHLLYPDHVKEPIKTFIKSMLQPLCEDHLIIEDQVGIGPEQL